jgi:soluble lytic murein transglycosylase-like protein
MALVMACAVQAEAREYHPALLRAWICAYAIKYHIPPEDALAVAHIESRLGSKEFRTGKIGRRYYGPMGIDASYLSWGIREPERNIEVGVRALSYYKDLEVSLRHYNKTFNRAYWNEIKKARLKYRREMQGANPRV